MLFGLSNNDLTLYLFHKQLLRTLLMYFMKLYHRVDEKSCEYQIILNNIRLFKRIGNNYNDTHKYKKEIRDIQNVLLGKQVDGIIYVGSHCMDVTGILEDSKKPVVYIYCYSTEDLACSVNYDDTAAAFDVTRYLIEKGHKKIALISGIYESIQCQDRFKGYHKALNEYNILYNPLQIYQ
jgi:LacI family transcriptional regulator